MAVKLDMSKAHDKVEWVFLEKTMTKMCFDNKWIKLIMSCINSVSYSVLINGVVYGCITPTRGLCQGNPLSSYLFLLCIEGLMTLIVEAKRRRKIFGIFGCMGSPIVAHLLFVDDSMIYCKASKQESRELCEILHKYEEVASQKINIKKSLVFFSKNIDSDKRSSEGNARINARCTTRKISWSTLYDWKIEETNIQ